MSLKPPVPCPSPDQRLQAPTRTRQLCPRCQRPQTACLCAWVRPTANEVPLLVLQDPQEQHEAKGSVRLLQLSLARSRVEVGTQFAPDQLMAWLQEGGTPVLLYSAGDGDVAFTPEQLRRAWAAQGASAETDLGDTGHVPAVRLVVLDGTWRKSRKLLLSHPALQALPRLSLQAPPPSSYRIRKAHAPHQLSTLEACCHALAALEAAPVRYAPLLLGFDGFIAQQLALQAQGMAGRLRPSAG